MGDYTHTVKSSEKPILASEDWTEIPNKKKRKCHNCNSENTICIYEYFSGSIIGYNSETEYYCKDCKYFTLYETDYES